MAGLHHVALHARRFEKTLAFYTELFGMAVEWRPDADNVYLTSGTDNLAIHRATGDIVEAGQRLDHIGFLVDEPDDVDGWYEYLTANDVAVDAPPAYPSRRRAELLLQGPGGHHGADHPPPAVGAPVGDGLVPSRCAPSRTARATTRVAPTMRIGVRCGP